MINKNTITLEKIENLNKNSKKNNFEYHLKVNGELRYKFGLGIIKKHYLITKTIRTLGGYEFHFHIDIAHKKDNAYKKLYSKAKNFGKEIAEKNRIGFKDLVGKV